MCRCYQNGVIESGRKVTSSNRPKEAKGYSSTGVLLRDILVKQPILHLLQSSEKYENGSKTGSENCAMTPKMSSENYIFPDRSQKETI